MSRPRLLDLFCGAGGAAMGYHRAGFEVEGVDIEPHPDYPFPMIVADTMDILADRGYLARFGVVHASPPCQGWTTMANRARGDWPKLIAPVRETLSEWGGLYVIENVPGARADMRSPLLLHGGMFGLKVDRPRLFESNAVLFGFTGPRTANPIGVYGSLDGRRLWTRADGTEQRAARTLEQAQQAMGIDWMEWDDLREAIPPAYTEFLGGQLIDQLGERAA